MVNGTEERKKAVLQRIESLRAAAAFSSKLKPVISSFDGKQYNKNFDKAIRDISNKENHVYVSNNYGWIHIYFWGKYSRDIYLMSGYGCISEGFIKNQTDEKAVLFDGKKIKAAAMIENINIHRERLLKEAYDLETAFNDLDNIIDRLNGLKKAWESITGSIPYVLLDTYGIKRFV